MKTTLDLLISAGTHLGSSRVQPLMQTNVYKKRNGRYTLNPHKTAYILRVAFSVIQKVSRDGGIIIFYTRNPSFIKLLTPIFPSCSKNILITDNWASGTITNWDEQDIGRERPALLVVFQAMEARTPLAEVNRKGIPSIAILDSSDNPLIATYPIPGNSKGLKSFYLYARVFISALVRRKLFSIFMNSSSTLKRTQKPQFASAAKFRGNIAGSDKLSKLVSKTQKPKWASLKRRLQLYSLREADKLSKERPLERVNRAFGSAWDTKQGYKTHFGIKNETQWTRFKKLAEIASNKALVPKNSHSANRKSLTFLLLWESRLDINLWKSNLAPTLRAAKQYINHGFAYVNGQKSIQASKVLNSGDRVQLVLPENLDTGNKEHIKRILPTKIPGRRIPPFHLEVHYPSNTLFFTAKPQIDVLYYPYPLKLPKLL